MPAFLFTGLKGILEMLLSHISSQEFVAAAIEQPQEIKDKLAELSADEPLPPTYRRDNARLLAQSPRKVYLYWDLAGDPFATLRRAFGPQLADAYRLMTRLVNRTTGDEVWAEAASSRMQSFNVHPGHDYHAEVGLFAEGRAFIRLLASETVRTPRAGVASRTASDADFGITALEFARVLDEAGYVGDALEVTLEAADEEREAALSRALAQQFAGTDVPELDSDGQAELRSLLAALAMGFTPAELEGVLSRTLSAWLGRAPGDLTAERLLDLLRATLGLSLTGSNYDADAVRRVTRFTAGGSLVNLPTTPFHLWLPSMTAGARRVMSEK
jgi:hypothetical protein